MKGRIFLSFACPSLFYVYIKDDSLLMSGFSSSSPETETCGRLLLHVRYFPSEGCYFTTYIDLNRCSRNYHTGFMTIRHFLFWKGGKRQKSKNYLELLGLWCAHCLVDSILSSQCLCPTINRHQSSFIIIILRSDLFLPRHSRSIDPACRPNCSKL